MVGDRNRHEGSRDVSYPESRGSETDARADSRRRLTVSFAELSAFIVVFSGLIYLFGLSMYVIPIFRTYTHYLPGAWYAASLVPKAVVAGHGAMIWSGFPLYSGVGFVLLVMFFDFYRSESWVDSSDWFLRVYGSRRWGIALRTVYCASLFVTSLAITSTLPNLDTKDTIGIASVSTIVFFFLLESATTSRETRKEIWDIFRSSTIVSNWRRYLMYLTLIFGLWLGIVAVFVAPNIPPPLPTVEIDRKVLTDDNSEINLTKGALLAHTEGFWYVFNQNDKLIAIPDSEVNVVQISAPQNENRAD